MSDPEPKPIRRLEETDDDRLRVVTASYHDFYHTRANEANVLTSEYEDLFVSVVPKQGGPERLRVGTAANAGDADGWHLHGSNGIYAEVSCRERQLTDAEIGWNEQHFAFHDTETAIEFEIPHPEDLRSAILDQDLDRFDCLEAVIEAHDTRHDVLTTMQQRIEETDFRATRLNPRKGQPIDLDPEWDPENDHNDEKDRQALYDMASMQHDSHLLDFASIAGFEYREFVGARWRVLGIHEPNLEPYNLVALDVVGADGWAYCRECGAVAPEEQFLHVDLERVDGVMRVCDRCGDRKAEYDHAVKYTPENVAQAKDDRAQRVGGQRNLAGYGGGESDDGH